MTVRTPVVMMGSSGRRVRVCHLCDTRRPRDVTLMSGDEVLAAQFEEHRDRLTAVASRLLGSRTEAEDAVPEAWLRGSPARGAQGGNPRGRPATGGPPGGAHPP